MDILSEVTFTLERSKPERSFHSVQDPLIPIPVPQYSAEVFLQPRLLCGADLLCSTAAPSVLLASPCGESGLTIFVLSTKV